MFHLLICLEWSCFEFLGEMGSGMAVVGLQKEGRGVQD